MGYRSDVGLVLSKHGVSVLQNRLREADLSETVKEEVLNLLTHADTHYKDETTGSEAWIWESIKWYETESHYFQDVRFVADTIRDLSEDEYYFIRIGEDYDDADVQGGFWDNPFGMTLERRITITRAQ